MRIKYVKYSCKNIANCLTYNNIYCTRKIPFWGRHNTRHSEVISPIEWNIIIFWWL